MIRRLKYHEIDFKKYSECLENSKQRKYSASKDFLDITAGKQWEILMYNNYEAVMPVPFIKKGGLKIVVNPKLCQQLGIFSKTDNIQVNDLFLDFFERKYNIWYYAFNDSNTFSTSLKQRKNFLIFPESYETVRQRYSPKRKRKLRLDEEVIAKSEVREVHLEEIWDFISESMIGTKNQEDKKSFLQLFLDFEKAGYLKTTAFFYNNAVINAVAVFYDEKTVVLLGTFNNKDFVKLSGSSVIIDDVISKNIENKVFDFEGSEVPAIEEFFRGFRPELVMYPVIAHSKQHVIKRILKVL
ncbi:hypothetical protein MUU74_14350 [Chryseobacterium daecheongense]|uniref:hypothetical protein n=1 Tax=Chryseobacterium daecheongense TaxID=192389 RepID=UPI001FD66C60|nr:hypothetical protein [Chryseobacterium daecheongense]UOU97672.1 hypothetical protein MUU74_14350 [Chryseobacterium daecheongense]